MGASTPLSPSGVEGGYILMKRTLSPFQARVRDVVHAIPRGSTLAYSQVALRAGKPGAARAVVRALHGIHQAGHAIPWWRVIRANRTLAPQVALEQSRLLAREGTRVLAKAIASRPRQSASPSTPRRRRPPRS